MRIDSAHGRAFAPMAMRAVKIAVIAEEGDVGVVSTPEIVERRPDAHWPRFAKPGRRSPRLTF